MLIISNTTINSDLDLIITLKEANIDYTYKNITNFDREVGLFKYRLVSTQNNEYDDMIDQNNTDITFKIIGNYIYNKEYNIFIRENNAIKLNLFYSDTVINLVYLDFESYD